MSETYDFVIVGGGPAGLSAAISAVRKGFSAIVLERGSTFGPHPRGEGVHHYTIFDEFLGKGFLEKHSYKTTHGAVYHSPNALDSVALPARSPLYFFEWHEFIDRLADVARADGATLRTDSEVTGILEDPNGRCSGVVYVDKHGSEHKVFGSAVLGCDGHQSIVGQHYGVRYDKMSCPMIKCRLSLANFNPEKTQALQFYFIGNGDLDEAPTFPPAVAYAFPLEDQKMEVGLMLRMAASRTMPTVEVPSKETLMEVWSLIKESYPEFSEYFQGATIDIEEPTELPNASLLWNNVPARGVVLIGDSAGFVDPFGSSGIYFSMSMARLWTEEIADSLRELRGDPSDLWSIHNLIKWRKKFYRSKFFKRIAKNYLFIGSAEWYMYRHLRTADRINQNWPTIQKLMKSL